MTSFFHSGGAPSAPPRPPSQRAGGAAAPPAPPLPAPLSSNSDTMKYNTVLYNIGISAEWFSQFSKKLLLKVVLKKKKSLFVEIQCDILKCKTGITLTQTRHFKKRIDNVI